MATKKQGTIKATKSPKAAKPQEDLQVLSPDREITVAGKKVLVREYAFIEGLRIRAAAKPLIEDLQKLLEHDSRITDYIDIIADHQALAIELMAISSGLTADEITALSDNDGLLLADVWWTVNGPFFMRAVWRKMDLEKMLKGRAGQTLSSTSSAPGTDTATSSTATQSDK